MRYVQLALILGAVGFALPASAAKFVVTTTEDSGGGSLRQAITLANQIAGPHEISFAIPGDRVQTIAPFTALPDVTNRVTLDGYTQPGSRANSMANGDNAILRIRLDGYRVTNGLPAALRFRGSGNVVRGLVIVRWSQGIVLDWSGGNTIAGNWVGLDVDGAARGCTFEGISVAAPVFGQSANNVIGGLTPADRNVISGNRTGIWFGSRTVHDSLVLGNFIGTDASGTLPRGNLFAGVSLFTATNIIVGGTSPGARNVISASTAAGGVGIGAQGGSGHVFQGNYLGTDVSGQYDLGNSSDGIFVMSCTGVLIGGTNAGAGNLIGNNLGNGVNLQGSHDCRVEGNCIGTDPAGIRPLGNASAGVYCFGASTNCIGGLAHGAANLIQFNTGPGISVFSGEQNEISANRIYDNGGLGIDLASDGATTNDFDDSDTGANQLQNSPELAKAEITAAGLAITGSLQSTANRQHRLEFFSSPPWDPLWVGEGQTFLGTAVVMTAGDGHASFALTLPASVPLGDLVTATATDPVGNTSEFSAGIVAIASEHYLSLTAAPVGNTLVLRWPSATPGFVLESSPQLGAGASWTQILSGIVDDGVWNTCVIPLSPPTGNRFFRLHEL